MLGPDIDNDFEKGIIPRMVAGFFNRIESAPEEIEFTVKDSSPQYRIQIPVQ